MTGGVRGDPKTRAMVDQADAVEVTLTSNETEALLLEMTLIGRHQPRYNVSLHSFPYIKITDERFPRIFVTRERHDERTGRYRGPFTDASAVRRTVELTNRAFRLRTCKYVLDKTPYPRPCLDYETGICRGPCAGVTTPEDYRAAVAEGEAFILGKRAGVVRELKKRMTAASARRAYEEAAYWRDVLRGLERATADQTVVVKRSVNADVFAVQRQGAALYAVVLRVREGRLVDRMTLRTAAPAGDELEEVVLGQYGSGAEVPPSVVLPRAVAAPDALAASLAELRGGPVTVIVPRRGEKARLVTVARRNLEYYIAATEISRARRGELGAAFAEIGRALALPGVPRRFEMVDVSNFGGGEIVGSLVVFRDGVADKNDYRRYRLRRSKKADDLAGITEVVERLFARVKRGEAPAPDLLVVDGGVNQLAAAGEALNRVGHAATPVAAFAKDPDRLYTPGQATPLALGEGPMLFLARLRDEAHRFAVRYSRRLKRGTVSRSALDAVRGIGPTRKKALLKHFGSVEGVAAATLAELGAAPKMTRTAAAAVYDALHGVGGDSVAE
jgi:excinuclease ABC subunit C